MRRFLKATLLNQKGFSLIESILTVTILSVGLWGGIAVMQNATAHSVNNDMRVMASQLGSEKIEEIIADKTFQGYNYIDNSNYPTETLSGAFSGFTRNVNAYEVDSSDLTTASPGSGYKRVDIQVSWGANNGETITLNTIVTNY